MFTIDKTKVNNGVDLIAPIGLKTFTFTNLLTKEKVVQDSIGVSNGVYSRYIIDGTVFKGGSYVVNVSDIIATKCVVIGVNNITKNKYQ